MERMELFIRGIGPTVPSMLYMLSATKTFWVVDPGLQVEFRVELVVHRLVGKRRLLSPP